MKDVAKPELATLGGGCFWCLEAALLQLKGVESVVSGYAGGATDKPDYHSVCSGSTGHAEVVEVRFDPDVIDYRTLLTAFFAIHDPTTLNRQGNDVGPQYRSIAFYANDAQKKSIDDAVARTAASGEWRGNLVTEVQPLKAFYAAEDYHQEYFELNGEQPYCSLVIAPKVAKFKKRFAAILK